MQVVGPLIVYGICLLISGIVFTVLIWPFALVSDHEANRSYSMGSAIIYVFIVFGQLITLTFVALLALCKKSCACDDDDDDDDNNNNWKCYCLSCIPLIFLYYTIVFSCGAGQLVVVVLMSIDTGLNTATNVKVYGGFITAFTAIYMLLSFIYSTLVFTWSYHKWNEEPEKTKV